MGVQILHDRSKGGGVTIHWTGLLDSSLVPRPYAHVRERVWLHKSKSLGPLQNLKASNEITKRRLLE